MWILWFGKYIDNTKITLVATCVDECLCCVYTQCLLGTDVCAGFVVCVPCGRAFTRRKNLIRTPRLYYSLPRLVGSFLLFLRNPSSFSKCVVVYEMFIDSELRNKYYRFSENTSTESQFVDALIRFAAVKTKSSINTNDYMVTGRTYETGVLCKRGVILPDQEVNGR